MRLRSQLAADPSRCARRIDRHRRANAAETNGRSTHSEPLQGGRARAHLWLFRGLTRLNQGGGGVGISCIDLASLHVEIRTCARAARIDREYDIYSHLLDMIMMR